MGQVNDRSIISHGLFWFNGPLISRELTHHFLRHLETFRCQRRWNQHQSWTGWLVWLKYINTYIQHQIKLKWLNYRRSPILKRFIIGRRQKKSEDLKSGGPTDFLLRPGYYPLVGLAGSNLPNSESDDVALCCFNSFLSDWKRPIITLKQSLPTVFSGHVVNTFFTDHSIDQPFKGRQPIIPIVTRYTNQ